MLFVSLLDLELDFSLELDATFPFFFVSCNVLVGFVVLPGNKVVFFLLLAAWSDGFFKPAGLNVAFLLPDDCDVNLGLLAGFKVGLPVLTGFNLVLLEVAGFKVRLMIFVFFKEEVGFVVLWALAWGADFLLVFKVEDFVRLVVFKAVDFLMLTGLSVVEFLPLVDLKVGFLVLANLEW